MTEDVSRETRERLEIYARELARWNRRINLVSRADESEIWTRHVEDAAQLFALAPPAWRRWVDLGSGGGLPGIVIAILAREDKDGRKVHLIERDGRKAAFLRTMGAQLDLDIDVHRADILELPPLAGDVVSARALAPLGALLAMARRHLAPSGTALFPKGRKWQSELDAARQRWSFEVEALPSRTDPHAAILRIPARSIRERGDAR